MTPTSAPDPATIFETLNAYQRTAALRGAIELGLFSAIADGAGTSAALAAACQADPRAMRILCDFLVVDGFLDKRDQTYALTPTAELFLVRSSPQYMGSVARFLNSPNLLDAFRDVAELVRRGSTLLDEGGTTETEYDGWVDFARSMTPLMMPAAEFIAGLVAARRPGPIRVLDVAAGHGMFGVSVAQRNPAAKVVALDWPNVLAVAEENAARAGVSDRHSVLAGDALEIDFGTGFDVVLITNFLHHFPRAVCVDVLRKVVGCLQPDGLAVMLEFVPNDDRISPPMPARFAMTMLGTTPQGDAYTFAEYQAMWEEAGFRTPELLEVPNSVQQVIVSQR